MQRLERKHPLSIRWFHWINFVVLAILVWSGLLIYWANAVYGIRFGSRELFHFFPDSWFVAFGLNQRLAEGMAWHFFAMWLFAANGLLYVLALAISGEWRHLVPKRGSMRIAIQVFLHDLHLRKAPPEGAGDKYNGAQRYAYTGVVLMGIGSVLTGLAIHKPIQASGLAALLGGYDFARQLHFWLMGAFVLFFGVHVAQVMRAGWNNFRAMVTGYELTDIPEAPKSTPAAAPALKEKAG
ncbi:MAG: cytochrome b/b6 domain-containing protein [Fimbriimonas ginsengisoli]|uniref:Cytochrome b/b6 domain-containing protein n=1 Tax=Fimbriimonas ginsengisoli TaxID=1005039 RepID=A0A931PTI0_FIMGI|nr:cytochrome b/b6 domain-containing protein [Fimbriimonas ginsengisoli]